ncbi:MAG: ROK family protein [Spirochaetaceae bacterium]|nr:MAG: ROK family protein [Spirochaetaceae bacterium]
MGAPFCRGRSKRVRAYVAGLDLGGSSLKAALFDPSGIAVFECREPTPASGGAREVIETIVRAIANLSEHVPAGQTLRAVGIGTPGLIDDSGTIHGPAVNIAGWQGTSLTDAVCERTGIVCIAGNDVNLAALAEAQTRGCDELLLVALGTGIGGGVVSGGRVVTGNRGMGGEIGHVVVVPDGDACACGQRGCVERYAGSAALIARYRELTERGADADIDVAEIARRALAGDADACTAFANAARMVARAIGYALSIVAPEVVVIGGGIAELYPPVVAAIDVALGGESFPYIRACTRVESATVGNRAGVIGAGIAARDLSNRIAADS